MRWKMYLSKSKFNHFHIAEIHTLLSSVTYVQNKFKKCILNAPKRFVAMIHFCAQTNEKFNK
jgi:hypothetical protein